MNITLKLALASAWASLACSAFADIRDQLDVNVGIAELVFPHVQAQDAAEKVRSALAQFAIPASLNYRAMGAAVPARPGAPVRSQQMFRGAPVATYGCEGSYAEVLKRPPAVENAFTFVAEQTQACLYNFQGGVKAYLVFSRAVRTESLTSSLFKGITNAIQGTDDERIAKELQWSIAEIRKAVPEVLVERIDIPGRAAVEPDAQAVARIIPAAPAAQPLAASAVPAAGASVAAAAPAANTQQVKVAARKDLTGMGLTFHSQDQFFQAIRRKDDVAVSLFLAGGGVEPATADASGMTALALAESLGAADIVTLLRQQANAGVALASAPAASLAPAAPPASTAIDAAVAIPAELKAKIDAQIDGMDLPPAEKEVQRAVAYRNLQSVLRSVEQIKAMAQRQ